MTMTKKTSSSRKLRRRVGPAHAEKAAFKARMKQHYKGEAAAALRGLKKPTR